jgi:hypothetical protein
LTKFVAASVAMMASFPESVSCQRFSLASAVARRRASKTWLPSVTGTI